MHIYGTWASAQLACQVLQAEQCVRKKSILTTAFSYDQQDQSRQRGRHEAGLEEGKKVQSPEDLQTHEQNLAILVLWI